MKKYLLILLLSLPAVAQNGRFDGQALGPKGPVPNASVAVCAQPANTVSAPCSPLAVLCASLTDTTCTSPNPITADNLGNYHFYAKSSQPYTVQLYGPQVAVPFVQTDQFLPSANGAVGVNVTSFGAKCDGVTDDHTAFQNAINALPSTGGTVYIPSSTTACVWNAPVTISTPHVALVGAGNTADIAFSYTFPVAAPTRILAGAGLTGNMLTITSNVNNIIDHDKVEGIEFDCAGNAAIGVQLLSVYSTVVRNVTIRECSTAGLDLNTLNGQGQPIDTAGNATTASWIEHVTITNSSTTNGQNGTCLRLTGTTADNTFPNANYNYFFALRLIHTKAPAISCLTCDSNSFYGINILWNSVGTPAAGVLLDASQTGAVVNSNNFFGLEPGNKGILQRNGAQADTFFVTSANGNTNCQNASGTGGITCFDNIRAHISTPLNVFSFFTNQWQDAVQNTTTTLSATNQMMNVILDSVPTSAITLTTDSAANMCTGANRPFGGNGANLGMAFDWVVKNESAGANTITIAAGTGVTIDNHTPSTIAQNVVQNYKVFLTSCTAGSESAKVFGR